MPKSFSGLREYSLQLKLFSQKPMSWFMMTLYAKSMKDAWEFPNTKVIVGK